MKYIAPAHGLPADFAAELTPAELVALTHDPRAWLRPDQRLPEYAWRVLSIIAGRGWGKSLSVAAYLTRLAELHGHTLRENDRRILVVAPNEHRVRDMQIAALLSASPPWFRAEEYKEGLRYPNGVRVIGFTPEAPERPRGENALASWLEEITDYPPRNSIAIYENIYHATRVGPAKIVITTTSKAGNALIALLQEMNARDPVTFPMYGGTTYDNTALGRTHFRTLLAPYGGNEANRRYREEVMGEIFAEAAGALFTQARLNANRVPDRRDPYDLILVGLDPAYSTRKEADATGIVIAGRKGRDIDILDDLSDRLSASQWAPIVVNACIERGAAGIVVETNHAGDASPDLIRAAAKERGIATETLKRMDQEFEKTRGKIYLREIHTREGKIARGEGPAALSEAGRLHMVGVFSDLEAELVTFEGGPGVKSPNRYDAMNYVVTELADLRRDSREAPAATLGQGARDDLRARLRGIGRSARVL